MRSLYIVVVAVGVGDDGAVGGVGVDVVDVVLVVDLRVGRVRLLFYLRCCIRRV